MATISDVAREAGVSVATVSRVLNNQGVVREDTARRVNEAIRLLSYEPNLLARNFRKNQSRVMLIVTSNITNPYYAHILSGVGDEAREQGYAALIFNTEEDPGREREALAMLDKRRADGAILMASGLGCGWLLDYAERHPVVQCSEFDPEVDIPHVSVDNYAATKELLSYLLMLGHRRIATISSTNPYYSTHLRRKAYLDVLAENGMEARSSYIELAADDYSLKSGQAAAMKLLTLPDPPTAILCIADTLALGAVMAAMELGLKVPGDVTVTGFDDVEFTTMLHPYLTTVRQPCHKLGRYAVKLLLDQMTGAHEMPRQLFLPHEVMVRESAGKPKQDSSP